MLTPLWLNLWGQQPFELPKVMLVRTLVWLLAGLFLADAFLRCRSPWRIWANNPLSGPVALLALVLLVTTVTAVNPRLSLWGSYERSQGAVTLLTYLLLLLLAVDHFRTVWQAKRLLTAVVLTNIPLVLFGLAQAVGWNPFYLVSDARSPVFATLGRANFLGAYLAMLVPLTAGFALMAQQRRERVAWYVLFVAELGVIGLTLARGAWLATAVSLSLFTVLWWGRQLLRRWRRLAWSGLGLLSLSGPLAVLWLGQQQIDSTAARLAIWQGTLKLIGERPFLGYGADSLGLIFPRVYPPELVYYQGRDFFVDRAHNLFLDWTLMAGIPGLLAFSLLLFLFFLTMHRALRQPQPAEKRILLSAIVAAVVANTINNLVSFDVTPTATALWLLMGLGIALTLPPRLPAVEIAKRPQGQWALLGVLVAVWGIAVWQANGRPLAADVLARQANRLVQVDDVAQATAAVENAAALWPAEPAHYLLLGQMYWRQAAANPAEASIWLTQAEAAMQTALQLRPHDAFLWLHLAEFQAAAARQFGYGTPALANEAYQRALDLAPNHAIVYVAWGRARLVNDDVATAAALLRQAVKLDASSGEAYIHLGAAELALGRVAVALADYQEAVRLLPESAAAYAGLAACYWQLDQPEAAQQAAAEALRLNPQNGQATAVLLRGIIRKGR
ncbi:MAG: hypothetical protein CL608_29075 [Anaerolineaceae bacterium]|nr:hypothetical protein [Anaerolineaceae bacterium]